ncbi:MAG: mono/diheme cytochrome c family protein [Flavobacteriales bacterium]|jgi:mono/diheme cytochrome c family protein
MVSRKLVLLLVLLVSACSSAEKKPTQKKEIDLVKAGTIFRSMCGICHGDDGKLGLAGAKDLSLSTLDLNEMKAIIKYGKGNMPPFVDRLSDVEIELLAIYIDKFKP